MVREIGQAQRRQAALARAQHLARTAQPEILLGDAKAVVGRTHDLETRARRRAERRAVEQQAARAPRAAADPAAQLVQLGEAEALGLLDHHHRRLGHVDPDLDHRGGDQQADRPGSEPGHHPVLCGRRHAAVHQPDQRAEARLEHLMALLGGGLVDRPRTPRHRRSAGRPSRGARRARARPATRARIRSSRPSGITRVSIVCRPGGLSRSSATAMSPYSARTSVRGIGVAVITSRSACRPLAARPSR